MPLSSRRRQPKWFVPEVKQPICGRLRLSCSNFDFGWCCEYPDPDHFLGVTPIQQYTRWRNQAYDRLLE